MTKRSRQIVFEFLEPRPEDPPLEKAVNFAIVGLIALNALAVVLETEPDLWRRYGPYFSAFETFSLACFSLEYALRAWSCVEDPAYRDERSPRWRYLTSPMALVDLLAILPSLFALAAVDLRILRVVRLFRLFSLFKMMRYSQSLRLLGRVARHRLEELVVTFSVGGIMLLLASSVMYFLEHDAQPKAFGSIPSALWWGVVTLATVGYGDVFPVTPLGRVFGGMVAIVGVGLFALPAGIIATGFHEELRSARGPRVCPHCQGDMDQAPAAAPAARLEDVA